MEIATYASLVNRKLLVPSSKKPFLAIDEHFVTQLLEPLLSKIRIDEHWYLEANPDVGQAIVNGLVSDARMHYCRFGYFEHRMPYHILVDEAWYLAEYPDVRDAVESKHFTSGQAHFEQLGYREGRIPYAGFSLITNS